MRGQHVTTSQDRHPGLKRRRSTQTSNRLTICRESGMYVVLKALHLISMFAAVTLLIGDGLFILIAIWRRDVRALAALHRLAPGFGLTGAGAASLLTGIVLGLVLAAVGHLNFLAGWLIAAYVMVAAILLVNVSPFVQRLRPLAREAVATEAGKSSVEEVIRGMSDLRGGLFVAMSITVVLFVAIIADMVVKPF